MKFLRRVVVGILAVVVVVYAGALAYIYFMQRNLEYDPSGKIFAIGDTKLTGVEDVKIPTAEGASVTVATDAPILLARADDPAGAQADPAADGTEHPRDFALRPPRPGLHDSPQAAARDDGV